MNTDYHYLIGGLPVTLSGDADADLASRLPGMGTFAAAAAPNALHLLLDRPLTPPECRWVHNYTLGDGVTKGRFGIDGEGVYYYQLGDSVLRYDPRRPDEVECSPIRDAAMLRYALWLAYGILALWHGRVSLHSSVVVCQGKAVLCLGESGTGKSTHTRLWLNNIEGCHLLNDDGPIVAVENGEAVVYGSPWSGKTPCFRQERYPVAGLIRIVQAPYNRIHHLNTIEAFTAVQPSCPPALAHEERCFDRMVAYLSDLLSTASVYRLECLPDADAAHLSHNTLMGE